MDTIFYGTDLGGLVKGRAHSVMPRSHASEVPVVVEVTGTATVTLYGAAQPGDPEVQLWQGTASAAELVAAVGVLRAEVTGASSATVRVAVGARAVAVPFASATSLYQATVDRNAEFGPGETKVASRLTPNTSNDVHVGIWNVASGSDTQRTIILDFKADGYGFAGIMFDDKAGARTYCLVNLSTGAAAFSSVVSNTITDLGAGWYRMRATVSVGTGATQEKVNVQAASTGVPTTAFAGDGTSGVLFVVRAL